MILFRIDLSIKDGLGHYNRIKSLTKQLNLKKYKIIIDKLTNTSFFKNEKKNIISLYKNNSHFTDEKNDASLFLKIIKNKYKNPVVVKDSYRVGYNWEKRIYKSCKKVISISDFPEKKHFSHPERPVLKSASYDFIVPTPPHTHESPILVSNARFMMFLFSLFSIDFSSYYL